ncbi:MAG: hypothetical protein A3K19_19815 [Lentisphaerae bacterium RIFOXYB12_FULL_65_16]|nr:MAG: hypothetical protein A3K18_07535 [Lentisphaerae bacterium RIFOXYA12_64_32]OGV85055.1 MAG: hypothetical protein A3K19_19815 [Lentisphaerae bacterium RIFOXYB12_FULL_65_16]
MLLRRVTEFVAGAVFALCCVRAVAAPEWQKYPYHPAGTDIEFPKDEGTHQADLSVTMEWWYVSCHIEEPGTGKQYAVMVAYFKELMGHSLRLFDISAVAEGRMHTATQHGTLQAKPGLLDLAHTNPCGVDRLFVKTGPDGAPVPFQYRLEAHGGATMSATLDLAADKPPLLVGGDGYVQVGNAGNSWYYSLTRMQAQGELTIDGRTFAVRGLAWMDHQWGPFMVSPVPIFPTDTYEWFALQLDNGDDYMISNIFDRARRLQRVEGFGGLGWMLADGSTGMTVDFDLQRLAYWKAPCGDWYSAKWRVTEPSRNLDLVITPEIQDQAVPLPKTRFGQFYFWEGRCAVAGTIEGKPVKGNAFVELTHRFEMPSLSFTLPAAATDLALGGPVEIAWTVDNPDQGNPLTFALSCRQGTAAPVVLAEKLGKPAFTLDTTRFADGDGYVLEVVANSSDGTLQGRKASASLAISNHGPLAPASVVTPAPAQAIAAGPQPLAYPYTEGRLSFPKDEGLHLPSEDPFTVMEWFAHYAHLTAADGHRYFLFTTFVTYDPIEKELGGRFPHLIATLVDVTNRKTYHYRDLQPLAKFASGHAEAETVGGDHFRWRGADRPFQYEFGVTVREGDTTLAVALDLEMVKPPLVVNGTGYICEPKGVSGYYSQTRCRATGSITVNGVKQDVQGVQWIDRQWLGASFSQNMGYSYDWWALQLANNEEAIMFRIWDTAKNVVVMQVLEINHADGRREKVNSFVLTDVVNGWRLTAAVPKWDLAITPVYSGQGIWQSCDVTGTIGEARVTGLAAAEMAKDIVKEMGALFPAAPGAAEKKPAPAPQAGEGGAGKP